MKRAIVHLGWALTLAAPCFVKNLVAEDTAGAPAAGNQGTTVDALNREPTVQGAEQRLERSWENLQRLPRAGLLSATAVPAAGAAEAALPLPQQRGLAATATASFLEPEELRSVDGKLQVTLLIMKALNRIGDDPVLLRSYNGRLVGPTLHARAGDILRITLKNELSPDPAHSGTNNTLHDFNTTNLHMHGLHVSPGGNSDNVLLQVPPGATQEYEIAIPPDHPAGTFWYHAHKHGSTAAQVASGMSGALIIAGGLDEVPEIAKTRERLFVLQQIPYIYKNCFDDPDAPSGKTCFDLPEGVIEQQYEDWIFGPGTWDKLGRFTTVNGVRLPVIRLKPGTVERWRLIDSGMRERIELKLEGITRPSGAAPVTLPLHVIAEDGIALGRVDTRTTVELWPGYRADVLVQAPDQPGEYLLIDERTAAAVSLDGQEESRKYIARVIVEGPRQPMALPTDAQLAPYRPRSLASAPVTRQTAVYGIIRNPAGGIQFTINGRAFDEHNVRTLRLGAVDEWTLSSVNGVGPVSHPFHIHVNPFEVFSIVDDKGVEQLKAPIWRDTIILHEKWVVKMRTHYTDFTGAFVQHCHILDHEDQGMMELVEIAAPPGTPPGLARLSASGPAIEPYAAPPWSLPDAMGRIRTLDEFRGHPTVLFFFKGQGCLHCVEQVALFAARAQEFAERGIQLVGVTTDSVDELRAAEASAPSPFLVVADPRLEVFRRYNCFGPAALHGTFVLDAAGQVRWQTTGQSPFTGIGLLFMEGSKLVSPSLTASLASRPAAFASPVTGPMVEVEVRNTATADDDYIAWEPTPCRIRQVPGGPLAADLAVVLTNDPPQPVPAGRDLPLDGDVLFAAAMAPGAAPSQESLSPTLPKDGGWVPFVIAGKYPQASTRDKDAVIEVHSGGPTGPILQRHALMVRVRKDHTKLTAYERTRFLEALDYLNRKAIGPDGESRYMYFVRMHEAAGVGKYFPDAPGIDYYWPDLAHRAPGFIAWHRAFLLEFERELQKTFPDVALPYWVMSKPSQLFAEDFLGANDVVSGPGLVPMAARFAPDNPLYGWTADINGARNEPVQRYKLVRTAGAPGFPHFRTDGDLFKLTTFSLYPALGNFADMMETNPHNSGHSWTGPWMADCQTSPRDPIFWVFHTGFDRQWAHWQYLYDRFDPSGGGGSYFPLGDFEHPVPPGPGPGDCDDTATANKCVPITHRIADQLWPWSGRFGQAATKKGSLPQSSYATPVLHSFPAAPAPGLWPAQDSRPTPGDMIDYLGLTPNRLPMGYGYDDTPYGKAPAAPVPVAGLVAVKFTEMLASPRLPTQQRLAAVEQIDFRAPPPVASLLALALAKDEDDAVRSGALRAAEQLGAPGWIETAAAQLNDQGHPALAVNAVSLLGESMMFTIDGAARRADIVAVLNTALADPREPVRLSALWTLIGMNHSGAAVSALTQALQKPDGAPFRPQDAIRGLSLAHQSLLNAPLIRPYLAHPDPQLRAVAVAALGGDRASRATILQMLADQAQTSEVRLAALQATGSDDGETVSVALDIATNASEPLALRAQAIATVGLAARSAKIRLPVATLQAISQRLSALPPVDSGRLGPVVSRAVWDATCRLNSTQAK